MKISLNWVKQFTDVDLSIDELVTKIGQQLGAVEEVIDLGAKYKNIFVVKVVSCEKHPNADKLSLCLIDDGGAVQGVERNNEGYVQVVCGAPNVRKDMLVAWIPPGATVPSTYDTEPFVLDARELRGKISNGMLASAKELSIGDSHDGILEVDIESAPGTLFTEVYELDDYVIDIENKMFTHRPDCFGILGVAREIAGICNKQFKSPDWYIKPQGHSKPGKTKLPLVVKNEAPDSVPRFMAVAIADITVAPSPVTIQSYLTRVGIKPINNIVDATNYLMHLTGQPTHAYDYDKLKALSGDATTLIARKAGANEKVTLLNGKDYKINSPTTVIATDKSVVGVGGVMGALNSEVGDDTKNIVLECANFDMYAIRRTSMRYGLFTDAVTRFNKGQSPLQNKIIAEEAIATLQYVGGGHVASELFDTGNDLPDQEAVEVDYHFINDRLGLGLDKKDIRQRLLNVELDTAIEEKDVVVVKPPFWRTDLQIAEDIVEEVGRLVGYDSLPTGLPQRSVQPVERVPIIDVKNTIRNVLVAAGANEVLSYNFVHERLITAAGQDQNKAFRISNALSPDLQFYRMSLLPGVLEKVTQNIRSDFITNATNEFVLFELGKVHVKGVHDVDEQNVPHEFQQLALVIAADDKSAQEKHGAPFFMARAYLQEVLTKLNVAFALESFTAEALDESGIQRYAGFNSQRSAVIVSHGTVIGVIGEPTKRLQKDLKLPSYSAGLILDVEAILELASTAKYSPLPKYPKTSKDITLQVPFDSAFANIEQAIADSISEIDEEYFAHIQPLGIYSKNTSSKNVSFRLWLAHYQKSMTTEEANRIVASIVASTAKSCGAKQV